VEDIVVSVGRTGTKITPVAVLSPVVRPRCDRAAGDPPHQDTIDGRDIRVGDRVLVQRAGT